MHYAGDENCVPGEEVGISGGRDVVKLSMKNRTANKMQGSTTTILKVGLLGA